MYISLHRPLEEFNQFISIYIVINLFIQWIKSIFKFALSAPAASHNLIMALWSICWRCRCPIAAWQNSSVLCSQHSQLHEKNDEGDHCHCMLGKRGSGWNRFVGWPAASVHLRWRCQQEVLEKRPKWIAACWFAWPGNYIYIYIHVMNK